MRQLVGSLIVALMAVLAPAAGAQTAAKPLSYDGKTALVTGSTDGLGREIALALAAQGAHVIVHGRNAERGKAVVDEITEAGKGSATFYAADFGSMEAVRDFADLIGKTYPRLDLLVNNAGIAIVGDQSRRTSAEGHELQFAVNYLAGWVLVNRLRPNLTVAAPSRVINVSSIAANPIDFDDVMLEKPGAQARGYGQSKLAQVTMTKALAPAFAEQDITMISLHPATMMDTSMVREMKRPAQTSVDEGLDHVMSLVTAPRLEAGGFYVDGKVSEPRDPQPNDPQARERLLALSEKLTGVAAD